MLRHKIQLKQRLRRTLNKPLGSAKFQAMILPILPFFPCYSFSGYQFKVGQFMFLLFTRTLRQAQEAVS